MVTTKSELLAKLVEKQREYIKLLTDEINDMTGIVSSHGWKSKRVEDGIKLRSEIN